MGLNAKKAVAFLGGLLTIVSLARVSVLFLEAVSTVQDERNQDIELIELCVQGSARGSMKMRSACLQAQSDRASPLLLKAILRAVSTAFTDFSESVSSPGKMLIVVLFIISSVFLPVSAWLRAVLPVEDPVESGQHVVVLASDPTETLGRRSMNIQQRLTSALRRRGRVVGIPSYGCLNGDIERDSPIEIEFGEFNMHPHND
tara:strand:+ start:1358 stop:1963 length:606 start_codon:yes stop_codon:yes gene_type:complete